MKKDLWQRAEELFHIALEHSPESRRAFLDKACGEDTALRRQVETLLSQDEQAGSFLERPALADATATPGVRGSLVGRQFGPYRILSSLGAGGMGEVYRAHDGKLGRDVAIKTLTPQFARDPERIARFQREAKLLASLNHPNIAAIYALEASDQTNFLVLELVEGDTLADRIKTGPVPVEESLKLALQIAEALEAAHKKGVIHRDLKPGNIMVTDEGSAKLLDFGLAKLYEQDASLSTSPTADFPVTQAGAVLGTVAYMSPEQAQGQPADARSDIFSFGLVLYEMLSGRRAFSGDTPMAIGAALIKEEPTVLQASQSLQEIVRRCLAKQPSARYQKMLGVKTALEKAFEEKAKASPGSQPSIAVLPFADMSPGKDNDWFGDGLAEEIINALTHVPGLRVIARTSAFAFKGKQEDIRRIAEALGVANIPEGSVRKAGNQIRVTAQLITAADGSHLWSERYDKDLTDVFAIQDEISDAIAAALRVKLSPETTESRQYMPSLPAYEAYLKARFIWGKLRPELASQSKEYLEQAIAFDPRFALAHCGLADHFLLLAGLSFMTAHEAMPYVREEAKDALEIDPSLPEAHAMLGIVAALYDYDWKEAERRFQIAMAHDPVPPRVRQWYGHIYLLPIGRLEESLKQQELGVQEDPLNVIASDWLGATLWSVLRIAEAQAELKRILEFEEDHPWTSSLLALTYARQDNLTEALSIAEKASPMLPQVIGILAGVLKRMGKLSRAEELIHNLMSGDAYGVPLGLSFFHYLCEEVDKAAEWWEKVIEQRHPLAANCGAVLFRSTARWPALVRLLNLPEEAR